MDAPAPHAPTLAFEDFAPGAVDNFDGPVVTRDAIVAFARAYDPQPFHLDEEAARDSFAGELIASGWHSCALMMRVVADGFLLRSASLGAPGIEEVRWLRPVRPGDRLSLRRTVLETKASRSRPEMGLVRFRFELMRDGEPVLSQVNWIMFGRRGAKPDETRQTGSAASALTDEPPSPPPPPAEPAPFFDELRIGAGNRLGSHRFTAEDIVGFARQFDPQPFHLDREAARRGPFGALSASGWHTAAVWMKLMIERRQAADERSREAGLRPARLGPSPGFRDLKWLKPVLEGDTIAFASTVAETRPSASRPGWGLVSCHNTGDNGRGERVFEFRSTVLWEGR